MTPMRLWAGAALSIGAVALLAHACISVPPRIDDTDGTDLDADSIDGTDADADGTDDDSDSIPGDANTDCPSAMGGTSGVFRQVGLMGIAVNPGAAMIVPFPAGRIDVNGDFCSDDRTFVAPTPLVPANRSQYLICAGISGPSDAQLELTVVTSTKRKRIALGATAITGCAPLPLEGGERVQIEVTNHGAGEVTVGADADAGWLAVSTIQNNGDWGDAEGLAPSLDTTSPVSFLTGAGRWQTAAAVFTPSATTAKPYLMCGALEYEANTSMGMGIDDAGLNIHFLASAVAGVTLGCRIENVETSREISLRVASKGVRPAGPAPAANWVSVHRLQRNTAADWLRIGGASEEIVDITPGESRVVSFQNIAGVPLPVGTHSGSYGPVDEGGALVTCATLQVPSDMALVIVHGGIRTQIARGTGRLHGCLPTGLGTLQSLQVELTNMGESGDVGQTVAADMFARWYLVTLH